MLTVATFSSLLLSLATAAVIREAQQPLFEVAAMPMIDLTNQTAFKRLAIEDMSHAKFRLHHHAVKTLLGDESYLTLRMAEIEQRESEIWTFLWDHELSCDSWMDEDGDDYQYKPRVWMSGGRVFDADPEHVPQDVIDALEGLSEREWEKRRESRRQDYCNVNQTNSANDEKSDERGLVTNDSGPRWKVGVPEEYLQYLIPESALEEEGEMSRKAWKARDEKNKNEILAGRRSVRDMKIPDLSKCEKLEMRVWHDDY
jgi:hypothetical protein